MDSFEALRRNPFPQQFLSALVADYVQNNAAQCGSRRSHEHIQQETRAVLVHVAGDDAVQWQAEETGINAGNGEYAPGAQRLQQCPEEDEITRDDVLDGFQNLSGQCTRKRAKTAETR